jgi:hypothetical protein
MQWVQIPNQNNVDNLNNIRREDSRHCRKKKKEYLKFKIDETGTNSKIKNTRDLFGGIYDFKNGYQLRTNLVKDEKGDLVTEPHSILVSWRKNFSQLLNVRGINDVRQREIRTAEPLVPEPSAFEVEMATEKLKSHKSLGTDQIPLDLIKAGVKQFTLRSINRLILFGIRRNCLRSGRSR